MDTEDTINILEEVQRARGKAFGEARKMTMVQLQAAYIEHSTKLKAFELISKHKEPEILEEDAQDDEKEEDKK